MTKVLRDLDEMDKSRKVLRLAQVECDQQGEEVHDCFLNRRSVEYVYNELR